MDKYYLIIFNNTQGALRAESILKNKGIEIVIMPTPTSITNSCGISIRFSEEELENIRQIIKEKELIIKGIFNKKESGYVEVG